jgi:hypothetical protein
LNLLKFNCICHKGTPGKNLRIHDPKIPFSSRSASTFLKSSLTVLHGGSDASTMHPIYYVLCPSIVSLILVFVFFLVLHIHIILELCVFPQLNFSSSMYSYPGSGCFPPKACLNNPLYYYFF